MSATADKATRRDLRRAMGAEACGLLDTHEDGLKLHAVALKRHGEQLQWLAREAGALGFAASLNERTRSERETARSATVWARLRWLLRGDA